MNRQSISNEETSPADVKPNQLSFMQLLIVLAKNKKLIISLPLIAAIVGTIVSILLPNVYSANTKLLPPQQPQSGAAALLSQLGGVAGAVMGGGALKNPNDLYIGMLKSRTVADKLIAQFDLKRSYEMDSLEKTRKELAERTIISSGKDGLITVEVEDEDQKKVAKIANAYVGQLTDLTRVIAVSEASQRRLFYERQLEQAKDRLANSELALKSALDTHGVISVDSDSRAVLETIARLRAQVSAKEIQLGSMRAFLTADNPQYKQVNEDLSSLRAELSRLENGRDGEEKEGKGNEKPTGLQNIKLLRDVKYYQMLYELLAKQYEVARLDEAKDASVIQVLDVAVEPEKKIKPKRAFIVLGSAGLALVVAIFLAFINDARQKARAARGNEWEQLKKHLKA